MFINRDWTRTEKDDWKLNVQPRLGETSESVAVYDNEGNVVGWKIQGRFE